MAANSVIIVDIKAVLNEPIVVTLDVDNIIIQTTIPKTVKNINAIKLWCQEIARTQNEKLSHPVPVRPQPVIADLQTLIGFVLK